MSMFPDARDFINDKQELLGASSKVKARDIDLTIAIEGRYSELVNVKARRLVVWRCKEPSLSTQDEDELQKHLSKINFGNRKQVVKLASGAEIADLELGEDEVLLVQVPAATNLGSKKQKFEEESSSTNFFNEQSEGRGREVWNGRPLDYHAEPVGLYHPVFNEFHDAMKDTEPFDADVAT